jgi:hypothetical protein
MLEGFTDQHLKVHPGRFMCLVGFFCTNPSHGIDAKGCLIVDLFFYAFSHALRSAV